MRTTRRKIRYRLRADGCCQVCLADGWVTLLRVVR